MISVTFLVITVIVLSLLFDFLNGFHDAANSIATVVVTRTLTPLQAVILAGLANFVGYFTFGHAIAKMISSGILNLDLLPTPEAKLTLLLGALLGAVVWNIITWILGLPTSSSHALIGGLIGAGLAAVGPEIIILGSIAIKAGKLSVTGVMPIVAFIFIAPLLGMVGASFFTILVLNLFRKLPFYHSTTVFKYLQLVSASWYSIGHGSNDAQKMMGVISLALLYGGMAGSLEIAPWVAFSCYTAIGMGTMFGGWRIVKTMGTGITKIRATEGFCAESSAALVLMGTAHFGIPVSTTHVISGAIMGVGSVESARCVRWTTARRIV
ncbi:MAG: inorganic phosphate transporter, partial [Candidatus Latescibacterota bacterium]